MAIPCFAEIPLFVSSFQTSAIESQNDGQPTSTLTTLTQISGDLIPSVSLQPKNLTARVVFPKPHHTKIENYMDETVVIVKFLEGTSIRLRDGNLTTVGHDDLSALHKLLNSHKGRIAERVFDEVSNETRNDLQRKSGKTLADLNLYYRILLPGEDTSLVENLIDSLNQLPIVEIAYPLAKPAPPPTPDYTGYQGYLNAAPGGIDARYSWTVPGGTGSGVKIVDIEYSWNLNHEDLSRASNALMEKWYWTPVDPFNDNNHGTAVLGELIADGNGFGVTGISYNAAIGVVPAYVNYITGQGYVLDESIQFAADNLQAGNVILIEQQIVGPHGGSAYVPVEWYQAYFDAIQYATAKGVVVVEAAGNGNENLDDPAFQGKFNRNIRDSGAIIVGAGYSPGSPYGSDLYRCSFSDYGSRVDLQGWGDWRVTTTGYGDLYSGGNQNSYYTGQFSGTSSASPIVAGAAANLESVQKSRTGAPASPSWIRQRLVDTGTPQGGADHVGPRPNLENAISVNPSIATDKATYAQLETVFFSGTGFTPGGAVSTCLSTDNDGSLLCVGQPNADSQGTVAGTMQVGTNIPVGPQKFLGVDGSTGQYSNAVQLTIGITITVSYSVVGGGTGYSAPVFNYVQGGQSKAYTLRTAPAGVSVDTGSSWSVAPNPLSGSSSSERWYSSQSLTGTASTTTITFTYQHQYYLTTQVTPSGGGSISVPSGWQNAGLTVPVTATPNTDYAFNYWSLDGTNMGNNPSLSVAMNSAHGLTAFFLGSSTISVELSSASIDLGSLVILSGAITPTQPAGMTVSLSYSLDGSTWNTFIMTRTDGSGAYSIAWCPPYPNTYQIRASWSGNTNYAGSTSSASSFSVTGTLPPKVTLLVTGPPSAIHGGAASFDVLVTNPGDSLMTTLYIEVIGPGGYEYFDTLQVSVAAGSMGRFQFTWQAPSTSGTYQVMVGLIPPRPTSIGQTQITVT